MDVCRCGANQVGCFVLDGVKLLECCWSCTHSGKWGVFHHTPDLCLVDGGQALGTQEVNYSPHYSEPLTCSDSHCVYVASPVKFLVNGNPKDIDSGCFSNGNTIEFQNAVVRVCLIGDGHCLAFVWRECYLPLVIPCLDIVQILLHSNIDCFSI